MSKRHVLMTISYKWLREYLPVEVAQSLHPDKISIILTAVGLEVESMEKYEEVKGGLKGLVAGEVITCEKHPSSEKLKIANVSIGGKSRLHIVCGANNIQAGQKVIVAPVNTEIFPTAGGSIFIKNAKIRGIESQGMICSEDEIGLGTDHDGIKILPSEIIPGTLVSELYPSYEDCIFEIGLTPNRIDAMSHMGVASDICAYLSHHNNKDYKVVDPFEYDIPSGTNAPIKVSIEDGNGCKRYSGIYINGITVKPSPLWIQQRLKSIGVKSINNIVDITNFILHETGQPLHAFDAKKLSGNQIIVNNQPDGTKFTTLDEKQRSLSSEDVMISDGSGPICIGGVYGGLNSGVSDNTSDVFLESAWFNPVSIRKTSLRHGLRTDAATRFEKGTDISNTVNVLKRAAQLVIELAGGNIVGDLVDIYPDPLLKSTIKIKFSYLKKLSGKVYDPSSVKQILKNLKFEIIDENPEELLVSAPFSKPDISMPADIVEEILRIDGLDNIEIPQTISISPAIDHHAERAALKEKIADYLTACGCFEIFTNSIANSRWYSDDTLSSSVKMINSLSADLDIMRPSMLQSGLQAISYNINRKNTDLHFYEFGKTYKVSNNKYDEHKHLSLFVSGKQTAGDWKNKALLSDLYSLKGLVQRILVLCGLTDIVFQEVAHTDMTACLKIYIGNSLLGFMGQVAPGALKIQDIKQPVYHADLNWDILLSETKMNQRFKEISKYPAAERDLAIVIDKKIPFELVKAATSKANIEQLSSVELFDIFESEKIGKDKKSMAINYTFKDDSKTLTDKDIDAMMNKLIRCYENDLNAEIRK